MSASVQPVRGATPALRPVQLDRRARWLPGCALLLVSVLDLALGTHVVLGLAAVVPLLAGALLGPASTAWHGAVTVVAVLLLGEMDDVYADAGAFTAQLVRLGVIVVATLFSVQVSRLRERRDRDYEVLARTADAVQRAILPAAPQRLGPILVRVRYDSAAEAARVGGDLYGFAETDHGVRILIGDVRGKGLDAVHTASAVMAAFRERSGDFEDLAELLDRLEPAVLRAAHDPEEFVTAMLMQIDPGGRMTVARAGHPLPLLQRDRSEQPLGRIPTRPPLGLGGRALACPVTDLHDGDRVLLYTDGLTETRSTSGRFLPQHRISDALVGDLDGALDRLAAERRSWGAGAAADDVALVLLEFRPAGQVRSNAS